MKKLASKSTGITSGMGITAFFVSLFKSNELLPKNQKMPDEVIAKKVANEFPNRKSAQDFISSSPNKTVNSYRYRYNKGIFTRGIPPQILSFRYNSQGIAVNGKTGTIVLLPEEIEHAKLNHKQQREQVLREIME